MILRFRENRVRRAYLGGSRIDRFTGRAVCTDSRYPEEWIASAVEAFNPDCPREGEGLSICADGSLFRDRLAAERERFLGRGDGQMSILVKLLDAAERLVIQCHPTIPFAKKRFGSDFGKTECWYILDADEDAHVYLGFCEGITRERWEALFAEQDTEGMLACLHRFPVHAGELWFVEGGVPHAIGGGCFMIELQEPSDLMVIPERVTPSGVVLDEHKLHGGLGFRDMFDCFVYEGASAGEIRRRWCRTAVFRENEMRDIVDCTLTDKFAMCGVRTAGEFRCDLLGRYAVGVVTEGACTLRCADSAAVSLKKSDSFFVTADSGELCFQGGADIVLCLPGSEK